MTAVQTIERPLSLAERAAKALGRPLPVTEKACLLLDVSGSMIESCEPGRSKIDALRDIVRGLTAPRIYAFSGACKRVRDDIPEPRGGTALHLAFLRLRADGITRAVLITDGLPDDEEAALREVRGLGLDIFYVGVAPKPEFLDRLTAAARAGSRAEQASLSGAGSEALLGRAKLLLAGSSK